MATRTPWTSTTAAPPWSASASTLATPTVLWADGLGRAQAAVLVAGLLRRLEPGVVPVHAAWELLIDPVGGDLWVGHVVDGVLAQAPGERQRLLALLGARPFRLASVGRVPAAGLPRRLEPRGTLPLVVRELQADVVALDLWVGHVVAVLAHAPGERQRLPEVVAAAAAGIGGAGGLVAAAEAGHPAALAAAAARDGQPHRQQQAEQQP